MLSHRQTEYLPGACIFLCSQNHLPWLGLKKKSPEKQGRNPDNFRKCGMSDILNYIITLFLDCISSNDREIT